MTLHHPKNILLTCQEVQDKLYSMEITLLPVGDQILVKF